MPSKDPYKYFRIEARELLHELGKCAARLGAEGPASKDALAGLLRHTHTLKGAARVVRLTEMAELAHVLEELLEPLRSGAELSADLNGAVQKLLRSMDRKLAEIEGLPQAGAAPTGGMAPDRRLETVRLEISELDGVLESLRETASQLLTLRREAGGLGREGALALDKAERELGRAHELAGRMRLLPASLLFEYLQKAGHEAAAAQGKDLVVHALGAEQRVEAPVLLALQEALLHVVRNAVAHGLEEPSERKAMGKPAQGSLKLEFRRVAGRLLLSCSDDGRGIDTAAVRQAALKYGILAADAAETLGLEEALALLLKGGLSTAGTVTGLSGRGLGMDVLRESVQRLGAGLRIRSQPGLGTEVEITLPDAMASFPVLAFEAQGRTALLPFDCVVQVQSLGSQSLARGADGETLVLGGEGEALPYLPFAAADASSCIVVRGTGARAALGVEKILGRREAVVLPLPELAPRLGLVSGASLDASGQPCLVLDPDELVRQARLPRQFTAFAESVAGLPLLVVDDSLTTRMLEQGILETAGYAVHLASSGEEGLAMARKQRYGLILVDVEMPGMDGFQFIEQLKSDAKLSSIPAILVSSRSASKDKQQGIDAGASDYIVKGEFDQSRLLSRIKELLA